MTPGCHETDRKFYKKRPLNQEVIETHNNKQNMKLTKKKQAWRGINEQPGRACSWCITISLISIILIYLLTLRAVMGTFMIFNKSGQYPQFSLIIKCGSTLLSLTSDHSENGHHGHAG
jgi:hypothetical protein